MFLGFTQLDQTLSAVALVVDGTPSPINADALPTFRVYGPNGYIEAGTASLLDSGTMTAASNASPIVISDVAHGLQTGDRVTITGVVGNTAANGTFNVTRVSADTFSLDGSTGNGAYVSGGTWNVTGAYRYSITTLGSEGYELGENYFVLLVFEVSSVSQAILDSFVVN